MINKEKVFEQLNEFIENKNFPALKSFLPDMNEADIAQFLETLEDEITLIKVFKLLSKDIAAEVFAESDFTIQQKLAEGLSNSEISQIVNEMFTDDAVDFLEEMPANVVERILKNSDNETRAAINKLLVYPEHSAGSIMTVEMVDLKKTMTVQEALERIRKKGGDVETLSIFYATSPLRTLEGVVSIRDLLLAKPADKIEDIMETNIIFANTQSDREEVAHLFTTYRFSSLPIVDSEQKLVGLVTMDDVMDVIQDEATEDIQKMAAIRPTERPYLKTSIWAHSMSRITWLVVLSVAAIFTGMIITTFEDALLVMPILMSFIPMLMDTGGNCGAQSSTVVIRGMALGEIQPRDFYKVLFKEVMVALICGAIVGTLNLIRIVIQYGNFKLGIVVMLGLMATMIISKVLGAMLPTIAKKLKLDPALMSSPLITTIADIGGLLCFFAFAKIILQI